MGTCRGIRPSFSTNDDVVARATDKVERFQKLCNELEYYKWTMEEIERAIHAADENREDFLDRLAKFVHAASEGHRPFKR